MAKFNTKPTDYRKDFDVQLAGGFGTAAARQDAEALLRRAVLACLLWEDLAYETGEENATNIASLVPQVAPEKVMLIAIEARHKQKLRHVPLWLIVHMCKYNEHKKYVRETINSVITRADQMTDLIALYRKVTDNKRSIPHQMQLGLADVFSKFDEYQLAKYDRNNIIKLRTVLQICHPNPKIMVNGNTVDRSELYKKVLERTLTPPDTWEVALSTKEEPPKAVWERLINSKKIGNLAFLRNLRNMLAANVSDTIIREGLSRISDKDLLPLNFFAAAKYAPRYLDEIEQAMLRAYQNVAKLPGFTVFVLDVSGSMTGAKISAKSEFSRLEAGYAMAVLARESCERIHIYATAGSDGLRKHCTALVPNHRGFGLALAAGQIAIQLGNGGIFTRQALEAIKADLKGENPARIIVFSDSQDCDYPGGNIPSPFGKRNYIVDVSAHKRGINYKGMWDAEISGWSEHFLSYIAGVEGLATQAGEEDSVLQ